MEYIYNMSKYQKLHIKYPGDVMLQICVERYEAYLEAYMHTGNYKFKANMNNLTSMLELFINETFKRKVEVHNNSEEDMDSQ